MNGGQTMVVIIVAIVMIASIFKAKLGYSRRERGQHAIPPQDSAETLRLRDEVKQLKDRLHVLERIAVEKENSLANEIESLRDR
jgi:hypothetical protein